MSLSDEVVRILNERATHQINFHQGRFRIDAAAFRRVQSMIQRGEIGVEADPDMPNKARYDRNGPVLYLWRDAEVTRIRGDADSKGLIVHECVHIIIHNASRRTIDIFEEEAIAFLAQTIYRLAIQGYTSRGSGERGGVFSEGIAEAMRHARTRRTGRIFEAAQQIVFDHNLLDSSSCTPLFDRDIAPLREAIRSHPDYAAMAQTQ